MFDEIKFTVSRTEKSKEMISEDKKIRLKMFYDKDKYELMFKGNKMTCKSSELEVLKQFIKNINII